MSDGDEDAPIVGVAVTFRFTVALPVQLSDDVPTTVYTVVTKGDTVTVDPERFPGFHVQVEAPLALSVPVDPEHKINGVLVVVTVGTGLTNTKTVFVPIQPEATCPLTVYVVLVEGAGVTTEPVKAPGNHVQVVAPLDDNVNVVPAQTVEDDDPAVTVGVVPTDRFNVRLAVQPSALVPVTVYIVVPAGVTTTVFPVNAPGFQVQVLAPVLVSVAVLEEHKMVGLLVAVRLRVDTFTLSVVVPLHPFTSVPVTV